MEVNENAPINVCAEGDFLAAEVGWRSLSHTLFIRTKDPSVNQIMRECVEGWDVCVCY